MPGRPTNTLRSLESAHFCWKEQITVTLSSTKRDPSSQVVPLDVNLEPCAADTDFTSHFASLLC